VVAVSSVVVAAAVDRGRLVAAALGNKVVGNKVVGNGVDVNSVAVAAAQAAMALTWITLSAKSMIRCRLAHALLHR
jgi:hypothetical protein